MELWQVFTSKKQVALHQRASLCHWRTDQGNVSFLHSFCYNWAFNTWFTWQDLQIVSGFLGPNLLYNDFHLMWDLSGFESTCENEN